MSKSKKKDAAQVLAGLAARAPDWIAAGRLRGRWIGLACGKDSVILWRKLEKDSRFEALA